MLYFHSVNEMPVLVPSAGFFLGADANCNVFCLIAFLLLVVVLLPILKAVVLEVSSLTALRLRIPFVFGYERKIVFY